MDAFKWFLITVMAFAARLVSDVGMAPDNSALVLLHGILMSRNAWQDVVPLLSSHHYVPVAACDKIARERVPGRHSQSCPASGTTP